MTAKNRLRREENKEKRLRLYDMTRISDV
jgi:hypothetical protein